MLTSKLSYHLHSSDASANVRCAISGFRSLRNSSPESVVPGFSSKSSMHRKIGEQLSKSVSGDLTSRLCRVSECSSGRNDTSRSDENLSKPQSVKPRKYKCRIGLKRDSISHSAVMYCIRSRPCVIPATRPTMARVLRDVGSTGSGTPRDKRLQTRPEISR